MPNLQLAYGLQPSSILGSGANTSGVTEYEINATNTNPIYKYSLVVLTLGGKLDHAGDTAGGTNAPVGVLVGVRYQDRTSQNGTQFSTYWPGANNVNVDSGTIVKATVHDNPDQLFIIATDKSITNRATAQQAVGANASFGTTARLGNFSTGRSTATLSVDSIATTATLPLRIMKLAEIEDSEDYTQAGISFVVRLNAHFNASSSRYDAQTTAPTTGV